MELNKMIEIIIAILFIIIGFMGLKDVDNT